MKKNMIEVFKMKKMIEEYDCVETQITDGGDI
jgi:hypothetical protein